MGLQSQVGGRGAFVLVERLEERKGHLDVS